LFVFYFKVFTMKETTIRNTIPFVLKSTTHVKTNHSPTSLKSDSSVFKIVHNGKEILNHKPLKGKHLTLVCPPPLNF